MSIDGWWWLCMLGWIAVGVVVRAAMFVLGEDA